MLINRERYLSLWVLQVFVQLICDKLGRHLPLWVMLIVAPLLGQSPHC